MLSMVMVASPLIGSSEICFLRDSGNHRVPGHRERSGYGGFDQQIGILRENRVFKRPAGREARQIKFKIYHLSMKSGGLRRGRSRGSLGQSQRVRKREPSRSRGQL